jgi:hypothetical protein
MVLSPPPKVDEQNSSIKVTIPVLKMQMVFFFECSFTCIGATSNSTL